MVPDKYTAASTSPVTPPLTWTNVPATAQSLVLIVHDVDVVMQKGMGDNPHWIVFNIPPTTTSLAEGLPATPTLPDGAVQLSRKNGQGVVSVGYLPFAPPPGFEITVPALAEQGIYVPPPLDVQEMTLTALGGSLDLDTRFEPPASPYLKDQQVNLFDAFSITGPPLDAMSRSKSSIRGFCIRWAIALRW